MTLKLAVNRPTDRPKDTLTYTAAIAAKMKSDINVSNKYRRFDKSPSQIIWYNPPLWETPGQFLWFPDFNIILTDTSNIWLKGSRKRTVIVFKENYEDDRQDKALISM